MGLISQSETINGCSSWSPRILIQYSVDLDAASTRVLGE
jgi:hypothetical protein